MSSFEKIFWFVIAIFASIYIYLEFQSKNHTPKRTEPILKSVIKIVDDNQTISKNLTLAAPKLQKELQKGANVISLSIDKNIDLAFKPVYKNIDTFLDFHYSVLGEYVELGASATGKIADSIKKRLFKDRFEKDIKIARENIDNDYTNVLNIYISDLNKSAFKGIQADINQDLFGIVNKEISQRVKEQKIKGATLLSTIIIGKIVTKIASKMAIKAASKSLVKGAGKLATKSAISSEAAAGGAICGPFVFICAPIAATVAWFGTDKVIVEIDEYLNRDKLKKELISMIDSKKKRLKDTLKSKYKNSLIKLDKMIKDSLKNRSVKKRVKVIKRIIN